MPNDVVVRLRTWAGHEPPVEARSARPHIVPKGPIAGVDGLFPTERDRRMRNLYETMTGADYVVIDGVIFATDYLRVPDEFTTADDVVLEARRGDAEIDLTRAEIDDAEGVGEGVFRLKSGSLVRFLSSAVIH